MDDKVLIDGSYRELTEKEINKFKDMAYNFYNKGIEINDCWHDVIIEEYERLKKELK